jgi:hypothetical protein
MMGGLHWYDVLVLIPIVGMVMPWVIGFVWILPDANRRAQPGVLWALLTIPLSWVAVLVYVVVRSLTSPRTGT